MEPATPADLLDQHGIDPADLEAAPVPPARQETLTRIQEVPPRSCVMCADAAATARAVCFAGAGPRWAGLCWDHGMSVRPRSHLPGTLEGVAEDLRAAAREAGLRGRISFHSSFDAAARGRRDDEDP